MKVNKDQPQPTKINQNQQSSAKINQHQPRTTNQVNNYRSQSTMIKQDQP